jgi:hypothetical protein
MSRMIQVHLCGARGPASERASRVRADFQALLVVVLAWLLFFAIQKSATLRVGMPASMWPRSVPAPAAGGEQAAPGTARAMPTPHDPSRGPTDQSYATQLP